MNCFVCSRSRGKIAVSIFAAIVFLLAPTGVLAHARMIRSSPGSGTVTQPPEKVDLWFNELLDGQFNSIQVYPVAQVNAPRHVSFTSGAASVDAKDKTHLTVNIKPLAPGDYYVEWRVLSLDGHSAPGRFRFTVKQ